MKQFYTTLICVFLAVLLGGSLFAAEYQVKQAGTGDFAGIQDAIDVAQDGDTIIVQPGTYYENIHFQGKNIVLTSTDIWDRYVVEATVIDGQQLASVVTFAGTEDETCELSGFTITNGFAEYGGGICGGEWPDGPYTYTAASIANCIVTANVATRWGGGFFGCGGRIVNCAITYNEAHTDEPDQQSFGGGIFCHGCSPTIEMCLIKRNSADDSGGGIKLSYSDARVIDSAIIENEGGGISFGLSSPFISNCTISGNSGKGIVAWYSSGLIERCTISSNKVYASSGAGVYFTEGSTTTLSECVISKNNPGGITASFASPLIVGCEVKDNTDGPGIVCHGDGPGPTVRDCQITGNSNASSGGGGLRMFGGEVFNCLIAGNSAGQGGGIYCYNLSGTVRNCTIYGNTARSGGAIFCHSQNSAVVANLILWGNSSGVGFDPNSSINITYSCVEGGFEGEGNISADPLLTTGPYGDYYLSCLDAGQGADSPCIDAGSDTADSLGVSAYYTTRTDAVPDSGIADMGYHQPLGKPSIFCWINDPAYFYRGSLLRCSLFAQSEGPDAVVDVYVGFVLPDGSVLSLVNSGFVEGVSPWLAGIFLPSGFSFGPEVIFELQIPDNIVPGQYLFAAALTSPDAFSPISFSAVEFEIG